MSVHGRTRVARSPGRGRGVFAATTLRKNATVERAPVLLFHDREIRGPVSENYLFAWQPKAKVWALALGHGSLYNHSFEPNAWWYFNYVDKTIDIFALRAIAKGEEILVNYNGDPDDRTPVWFTPKARRKTS